jgi:hypothetical protein
MFGNGRIAVRRPGAAEKRRAPGTPVSVNVRRCASAREGIDGRSVALRMPARTGSPRADRQPLYKRRVFWYSEPLNSSRI